MKLSQLSLADYNQLDSIPVINQDLSASEFTPTANTYYRHTGTGGGTPAPVNPYIVNQEASNQYINAAFDPMSNISQFVFDGQIGHMLGYNEAGIISDVIKMVKIADGHYQLQYTVDGETYQTMWDNTLPDPWSGLKQIGTLERDKVYYWKSDMGLASMVENQNVWGAYISKDGQWTSGGSAYTTGAIYYYNGTEYKAITGETGEPGATDYNVLENIPVINQDLSATDFTPVANTYYRHTGATTDTFTQGVIYLYDTAYHKLGESGGGTTLNKYDYSGEDMALVRKIMEQSEVSYFDIKINSIACVLPVAKGGLHYTANGTVTDDDSIICVKIINTSNTLYERISTLKNTSNVLSFSSNEYTLSGYTKIIYFNSTEITA